MDASLRAASGALVVAVLVAVVTTAVGAVATRVVRSRKDQGVPLVAVTTAGYAAGLVALTLWPAAGVVGRDPTALTAVLGPPASALEIAVNLALFVPLGAGLGWLGARRAWIAIVLPLAIEAVQLLAAPLHRQASVIDAVATVIGLMAGLVLGQWCRSRTCTTVVQKRITACSSRPGPDGKVARVRQGA